MFWIILRRWLLAGSLLYESCCYLCGVSRCCLVWRFLNIFIAISAVDPRCGLAGFLIHSFACSMAAGNPRIRIMQNCTWRREMQDTHTHTNIQTFVTVWNRYPPRTKYLTISKAWSIMRTCDLFWLLMRANQKTDAWFGAGDSCCLVLHTSPEMQLEYVWMLLICACWFWWQWLKAVVHHHFWAQGDSGELGVSSTFTMLLHVPSCLNGFQQNIRSNYSNFSHSHGPRGNHMTSVLCTASYCDAKLEVEHYSASEHRVTTSEFRW